MADTLYFLRISDYFAVQFKLKGNFMLSKKLYFVYVSAIASISGILFGYDTGVISGAMIFLKQDFLIAPSQEGLVVSILLFGAVLGALLTGKFADHFGRKKTLIVSGFLYVIGTLGLSFATSLNMVYLFRFILGIPIGIASFATPGYISEIAPKNLRGFLVSMFQLAIVSGILITFIANYYLANYPQAWRIMFFAGMLPAIILLLGLFFLPESPRWLISQGMDQQAVLVLTKLRNQECNGEIQEIKQLIVLEQAKLNYREALFNKTNMPVFVLVAVIMLLQQFSGIDAIIYYAPQIFLHSGLSLSNSLFSTVLIGIVNLISTVLGLALIDKIGRRTVMIYGSFFMALALACVAYSIPENRLAFFSIIAMLCYICAFAMSTALVGWLITSEIFPLKIRGIGSSIGISCFWLSNIFISFLFPILLKLVSIQLIFAGFSLSCIVSLIYCIKYLPETKNTSLERIEKNLLNRVSLRNLGQ